MENTLDTGLSSVPQQTDDRIKFFKTIVEEAESRDKDENEDYYMFQERVFSDALSESEKIELQSSGRSTLNFPVIKPYLLQSLKNVIDSIPTINIESIEPSKTFEGAPGVKNELIAEIINQKLKKVLSCNNFSDVVYDVAFNSWTGGKGIFHLKTVYTNYKSFQQKIKIESISDPTTIFFDHRHSEGNRQDGFYVFRKKILSSDDFKAQYSLSKFKEVTQSLGSNSYRPGGNREEFTIYEFYYKKYKKYKIYQLKDGRIVKKAVNSIVDSRTVTECEIWMTRFCEKVELDPPHKLNMKSFPFIICLGEKVKKAHGPDRLLPYASHALDAQRIKNYAANFLQFELYNQRGPRIVVSEGSTTEATEEALKDPLMPHLIKVKEYKENPDPTGPMLPLRPPVFVPPDPISGEFIRVFDTMSKTIEETLGLKFPSVSEMSNMSGKALYNMADFVSGSNEVFMQNLGRSMEEIGWACLDIIPTIAGKENIQLEQDTSGKFNLPAPHAPAEGEGSAYNFDFDFDFDPTDFNISVKRGVNYKLQQQRNVEILLNFAKMYPPLAQFLFTESFPLLIENMDFNNKEEFITRWQKYIQTKEENPMAQQQHQMGMQMAQQNMANKTMDAHARLMKQEIDTKKLSLDEQRLAHAQHATTLNNVTELEKIKIDAAKTSFKHLENLLTSGVKRS